VGFSFRKIIVLKEMSWIGKFGIGNCELGLNHILLIIDPGHSNNPNANPGNPGKS